MNKSAIATLLGISLLALAKKGSASNVVPLGLKDTYSFNVKIKVGDQNIAKAIFNYVKSSQFLTDVKKELSSSNGKTFSTEGVGGVRERFRLPPIEPSKVINIDSLKMSTPSIVKKIEEIKDTGRPLSKFFIKMLGPTVDRWYITIPFSFEPIRKPFMELLYREYQSNSKIPAVFVTDIVSYEAPVDDLSHLSKMSKLQKDVGVFKYSGVYFFKLLDDLIVNYTILNPQYTHFRSQFGAKDMTVPSDVGVFSTTTPVIKKLKGSMAYDEHEFQTEIALRNLPKSYSFRPQNYIESYEDATSEKDEDDVQIYNIRWGNNIGWKDEVFSGGVMIPVKEEDFGYIRSRFGNIFDKKKLGEMAWITKKMKEDQKYAIFDAAYAFPGIIDLSDVEDYLSNLPYRFDGDKQLTTGDDDLDSYLRDKKEWVGDNLYYLGDTNFGRDISVDDALELYEMAEDKSIQQKYFIPHQDDEFFEPDEEDIITRVRMTLFSNKLGESYEEDTIEEIIEETESVISKEKELIEAEQEGYGDLGALEYQIRDGHHRVFGAIAGGEPVVWLFIPDDYSELLVSKNFKKRTGEYIGPQSTGYHTTKKTLEAMWKKHGKWLRWYELNDEST